MYSSAELHLIYKFANAPILAFPYPHFYIQDVFPKDFYDELQQNLPDPSLMIPIEQTGRVKGYKERFVLEFGGKQFDALPENKREFWRDFAGWLCSGRFASLALNKFHPFIEHRFKNGPAPAFYNETMLVQDVTKYSIGPHTDSPKKVITMLFYLPKDLSQSHLGTSIYLPKDPNATDHGGAHHKFANFQRLHTMPFVPNSLFVFFKTENSFHGVEPVTDPDTKRWLLLFDVYQRPAQAPQVQPGTPTAAVEALTTKFSM